MPDQCCDLDMSSFTELFRHKIVSGFYIKKQKPQKFMPVALVLNYYYFTVSYFIY